MDKRPIDEDMCSFYLERKKRPCRMKKPEGRKFCPHHSYLDSEKDSKKGVRIPCPLDSSHFCYESKLQKHLKKCNAREQEKPTYFILNVNGAESEAEVEKLNLCDISDEELLRIIQDIKKIYGAHHIAFDEQIEMHSVLQEEMERTNDNFSNFKHMKQQASLLSIMERHELLSSGSCFIEFGAGKGQLMYWIVQCVPEDNKAAFLLIDRSAQRHKSDNKYKGTDIQIQRIRIDIQHLCLGKIEGIQKNLSKVVGFSKHLCGCATDLALKCLTNTLSVDQDKPTYKFFGLVMAVCCHHRCSWNLYVGKEFMEKFGISERDFRIMSCIAGWATCSERKNNDKKNEEVTLNHATADLDEKQLNRYAKLNLSHKEREEIGFQCKHLIDVGRVHFLRNLGYKTNLVTYIDKSVSLENVAMVALNKDS